MDENKLKFKLNSIYLLMYGAMACYYPFLTVYLKDRGLTYTEIGTALAINSLSAVICQPVWGYITDRYLSKRRTLLILMGTSSLSILMFIFIRKYYLILFIICFFITFLSPISSIMDAYCYQIIDKVKGIQYGKVRLMGSAGYALMALMLGELIKTTNINISYYSYFLTTIIVIIMLQGIKFKGTSGNSNPSFRDIGELIKNSRYILFLLSVCVANITIGAYGNYIAVLIEKTGGNVSSLGMLWFLLAMSELPVFYFGNRIIKRYGDLDIYIAGIILYALRFLLSSMSLKYGYVMAAQLMQGVTFTFYTMGSLQYINKIVPAKLRTSGITIYAAIGGGLGGFIGNMASGMFLEKFSIFALYKAYALICIMAALLAFALKTGYRGREKSIGYK